MTVRPAESTRVDALPGPRSRWGRRVGALVGLRVRTGARAGRALPPLLSGVVLLGVVHAGGAAPAAQAYAFSAAVLFGVFGWQAAVVLDAEPDDQRLLARTALGARGEILAGLMAAGATTVPLAVVATGAPQLMGVLADPHPVAFARGLWLHLLSALCGAAWGAVVSRASVPAARWSILLLLAGAVLVPVLGGRGPAPGRWTVPPFAASMRVESVVDAALVTLHGVAWAGVLVAVYVLRRRRRP